MREKRYLKIVKQYQIELINSLQGFHRTHLVSLRTDLISIPPTVIRFQCRKLDHILPLALEPKDSSQWLMIVWFKSGTVSGSEIIADLSRNTFFKMLKIKFFFSTVFN